jgi:hypothetical protein
MGAGLKGGNGGRPSGRGRDDHGMSRRIGRAAWMKGERGQRDYGDQGTGGNENIGAEEKRESMWACAHGTGGSGCRGEVRVFTRLERVGGGRF